MLDDKAAAALEEAIGYRFQDRDFLRDALTHRSYVNERPDLAPRDNERMEFLGDALLDLAASALLFERYPGAREGELSRRRADIVCERTLAQIAETLSIGPMLRLGKGEEKTGGRDKPRLLASALEALIAAAYLDSGEREAITLARGLLVPHVAEDAPGAHDFKSRLQEVLQGERHTAPLYALVATEGPDHARTFHDEVHAGDEVLASGSGRSKNRAEQAAAQAALATLE
ncbi:MAG: ribonuclease III [Sandaracinaceae bacterium]